MNVIHERHISLLGITIFVATLEVALFIDPLDGIHSEQLAGSKEPGLPAMATLCGNSSS